MLAPVGTSLMWCDSVGFSQIRYKKLLARNAPALVATRARLDAQRKKAAVAHGALRGRCSPVDSHARIRICVIEALRNCEFRGSGASQALPACSSHVSRTQVRHRTNCIC